eukprot:TRINITY_DN1449_c0_g1_i1.p1 TRINITY_DN1449_c0_g1~~TRINITY_DN1449_c0_g1_i1.p1  ORF type:complete len:445 (-),score=58.99 TRINITY_DN1449_c0_g1_i1:98-1432(-)
MPFYEQRLAPLPSCFEAEECPGAHGRLTRNHSFPGYITFFMASACTEACTRDEIENISDSKEDILGMGSEDPSLQMWPDTDEEFFFGENVASSRNELASTYFQTPSESFCTQPPGSAIVHKPLSWADVEDEIGLEQDACRSQSTTTFPEPCHTWCSQPGATAECGSSVDAIAAPLADAVEDPWDVGTSNATQPLLLNLESALATPFAQHGATGLPAQPCPSPLWLPHLLKQASAQVLTNPDTPHSCAAVSLQSTAATPLSRASPLSAASPFSETTTHQPQAKMASFKMQETPMGGRHDFCFDNSPSCPGASDPNCRVPAAVGPCGLTSKMVTKAKAPGASGPSTRSAMQERKAFGALALKKARAMLPAVSPLPSADPATSPLEFAAKASPPAAFEGHADSKAMNGAQASKRPLPTLLQGRSGDGMLKSKWTLGPEKPKEIGVAH